MQLVQRHRHWLDWWVVSKQHCCPAWRARTERLVLLSSPFPRLWRMIGCGTARAQRRRTRRGRHRRPTFLTVCASIFILSSTKTLTWRPQSQTWTSCCTYHTTRARVASRLLFGMGSQRCIAVCSGYLRAFYFGLEVRLLPAMSFKKPKQQVRSRYVGCRRSAWSLRLRALTVCVCTPCSVPRTGAEGQKQLHVGDIFDVLKRQLPRDAFCLACFTMTDLYPRCVVVGGCCSVVCSGVVRLLLTLQLSLSVRIGTTCLERHP